MPDFVKLWYACKANSNKEILKTIVNHGLGLDVASCGELEMAKQANANSLIATGPAKTKAYLKDLLDSNVDTIVIESINQLSWLNEICLERETSAKVLLRVQLDWNEGVSVIGGDQITPFGLGPEDWLQVNLTMFESIEVIGTHIFQWGNILDENFLANVWDISVQKSCDLAKKLGFKLKVVDLGGGLGISYAGDDSIDLDLISTTLSDIKARYSVDELWMELGRFVSADCGYYLCPVVDIKTVRGREILVTSGGIHHMARPALTKEYFPCRELIKSSEQNKEYYVHGPLCTALDFLGRFNLSRDLDIGDWIVFEKCGAYGFTESMPLFLSHPQAIELV